MDRGSLPLHRRALLAWAGRAAAAIALLQLFGPSRRHAGAAAPWSSRGDDPFALGVASSIAGTGALTLWTRLAPKPREPDGGLPPKPIEVRWELAEDERFARVVRSGTVPAEPAHAHSVHVAVDGLRDGASWFYRFMAGDATSPVGRTRTPPAADADVARLRIALASCQHYEQGAFAVQREITGRDDIDFVLFVGDYIYESTNPRYRVRAHEGPVPTTLDGYRARHAHYKLDADLRAAHVAHPWQLMWDDHEVENDYAGERGPMTDDAAAFIGRRAAAYKAYFEHLPVAPSRAPSGASMRMHDRLAWGRLADLWLLDARQYRSPQACTVPGRGGMPLYECDGFADASRSVFGREQERWLYEGLGGSKRRWKLIAQASQLSPSGVVTPLGRSLYSDSWDGYGPARERLLGAIGEHRLDNVMFLGGDVHRHLAANLRLRTGDARSPVVAREFVTSSLTTRGISETLTEAMRRDNPDIVHARSDERGYALIDIRVDRVACEFRATRFPVAADAKLHRQAAFVAEAGAREVARD